MIKILQFSMAFALLLVCGKAQSQNWEVVGQAGFSAGGVNTVSLAFSNSDEPYVAFEDGGNGNKATVKKFDGNNWINVGTAGFSVGNAHISSNSLAFSNNDEPYVVFSDYANGNKATIMKFNGTNWVNVGTAGISEGSSFTGGTSLAFSNNNEPYVAYKDEGDGYKVIVKKFDGTNWVAVGTAGVATGQDILSINLAFSNDNEPYVAYSNYHNDEITVKRFDGTNWVTVGQAVAQSSGTSYLAFSNDGEPYVVFNWEGNKVSVKKFDGINWVNVGIAEVSNNSYSPSLAFSNENEPYVSFTDANNDWKVTVKKFDGTDWVIVGTAEYVCYGMPSLVFSNYGELYLAFQDVANDYKATVLKYAMPMSIDDTALKNVKVYPNPVKDILYLSQAVHKITITDLTGKVLSTQNNVNQINMSAFQNGVYFITIETENGLKETKKVVKR